MSAVVGEQFAEQVTEETDDNPSRMLHMICPWCYPVIPPVGTPTVRWCGQVVTIKDDGPGILTTDERVPADACVLCAELKKCSTCGAINTPFGIIPATGGRP